MAPSHCSTASAAAGVGPHQEGTNLPWYGHMYVAHPKWDEIILGFKKYFHSCMSNQNGIALRVSLIKAPQQKRRTKFRCLLQSQTGKGGAGTDGTDRYKDFEDVASKFSKAIQCYLGMALILCLQPVHRWNTEIGKKHLHRCPSGSTMSIKSSMSL